MKTSILILFLAVHPAFAQRQLNQQDLRRIEDKLDQIEFREIQKESAAREAEEKRLLALRLDWDLRGSLSKLSLIWLESDVSHGIKNLEIEKLKMKFALEQDARNKAKGM